MTAFCCTLPSPVAGPFVPRARRRFLLRCRQRGTRGGKPCLRRYCLRCHPSQRLALPRTPAAPAGARGSIRACGDLRLPALLPPRNLALGHRQCLLLFTQGKIAAHLAEAGHDLHGLHQEADVLNCTGQIRIRSTGHSVARCSEGVKVHGRLLFTHAPSVPGLMAAGATGTRVPRRQPRSASALQETRWCRSPWEPLQAPGLHGPGVALRHPRRRF